MSEWLSLLFPFFTRLVEALAEGSEEKERQAMIDLQTGIARKKAEKKLGPRPPT